MNHETKKQKKAGLTRLTVRCLAAEQQLLSVSSTSPLSGLWGGSCTAECEEQPADLLSSLLYNKVWDPCRENCEVNNVTADIPRAGLLFRVTRNIRTRHVSRKRNLLYSPVSCVWLKSYSGYEERGGQETEEQMEGRKTQRVSRDTPALSKDINIR